MHYAAIKTCDVANGPGVRTSLFVSGCRLRCPHCFNREAWDFAAGHEFDDAALAELLASMEPGHIAGLTILGGEPMEPENQVGLLPVVQAVRAHFGTTRSIWLYSGHTWDELIPQGAWHFSPTTEALLRCVDVLVDGPFVQSQYDPLLRFRGSSNQRIIDVAASLAQLELAPVLWADHPDLSLRRA